MSSNITSRVVRLGEKFRHSMSFTDEAGDAYDPDSHSIQLITPAGVAEGEAETSPTGSAGSYTQDFTIPSDGAVGTWRVVWTATTGGDDVIDTLLVLVVTRQVGLYCSGLDVLLSGQLDYELLGWVDEGDFIAWLENDIIPVSMRIVDDFLSVPSGYFSGATITDELHDHDGSDTLHVDYPPIVSVSSLYKNDAGLTESEDWEELSEGRGSGKSFIAYLKEGRLYIYTGAPGSGHQNAKITYVSGYASTPQTIKEVTRDLVISGIQWTLTRKLLPSKISEIVMSGGDVTQFARHGMALTRTHIKTIGVFTPVKVGR